MPRSGALWPAQRKFLGIIGARGRFPKGNGGALRAHSREIVLILAGRYARISLTESAMKDPSCDDR